MPSSVQPIRCCHHQEHSGHQQCHLVPPNGRPGMIICSALFARHTVPCAASAAVVYVFRMTNLPSQVELVAAAVRPVHPLGLLRVLVPSHHNLPTGPSALSHPPRSLRTATQLIPGSRTRAGDSCKLSPRPPGTCNSPPKPEAPNCNQSQCRDLVLCTNNFYTIEPNGNLN